jgi:hypothetical protein
MHLGNLSMGIEGNVFRLLPVYDMCSMGFVPRSGDVLPYRFNPGTIRGSNFSEETQRAVDDVARSFLGALSQDVRISNDLNIFLAEGNTIDRSAKP